MLTKLFLPLSVTALAAVVGAWSGAATRAPRDEGVPSPLAPARLALHHSPGEGTAWLVFDAQSSKELERLELRSPSGDLVVAVGTPAGAGYGLESVSIELREVPAELLASTLEPGPHRLYAWTSDGQEYSTDALLSPGLPVQPVVLAPTEGAVLPADGVVVAWEPSPDAVRYQVIVAQDDAEDDEGEEDDEDDGIVVDLPPTATSFQVPPGVLATGRTTEVEVIAVGRGGNATITEVVFETR